MNMKERLDLIPCGHSEYQKRYLTVHILCLLVLTFICYWKFLNNYFVLEDTAAPYAGLVLSNNIFKIFTEQFAGYGAIWRVLVMLSYIPNYWLSDIDPWSYRLFSLFFHFLNSVLVYLISNRLLKNINLSFIIAILFSVSLNKVSAIGMVAHRVTLFGTLFPLLSLHLYIKLIQDGFSKKKAILFLLAYLASIGSYETGLIMPAVYITFGLLFKQREFFSKHLLWLNSICLFVSLYIIFSLHLGSSSHGMSIISEKTLVAKGLHMVRNILAALPSFIIPPFIIQDTSGEFFYYSSLTDFGWIELISIIIIIATLIYSMKSKNKAILFALLFFLITSIPISIIRWSYFPDPFNNPGALRFDIGRYSYLSSFGAYLIIGVVSHDLFDYISSVTASRRMVMIGAVSIFLFYIVFNIFWIYKRENHWQLVSDNTLLEVKAIKSLNLSVDRGTVIYYYFNTLFGVHGRNMLRALYKIPDLEAYDLNFEAQKIRPGNKKVIIVTPGKKGEYSDLHAVYLPSNAVYLPK